MSKSNTTFPSVGDVLVVKRILYTDAESVFTEDQPLLISDLCVVLEADERNEKVVLTLLFSRGVMQWGHWWRNWFEYLAYPADG